MIRRKTYACAASSGSSVASFSSKVLVALLLVGTLVVPFVRRPQAESGQVAGDEAGQPAERLILISPHWEGVRHEFGLAFSEWTLAHFGHRTELEWLDVGGTSDALRYVRSEFTRVPEGIGVDLFFGGGVDPFMALARENLLAALELPAYVCEAIPQSFSGIEVYDADKRWFGAALAGFGILHNKVVCERLGLPVPQTWQDLGRPEYRTWVGSGDPRSSGSIHMAYEIMLQAYGWEAGWETVVRMCGNTRNFSRAASEVPKDTALGEVACGMCIDVYAWRQVAEVGTDRMGFVLPEGVTVINPDGIAVLKGAPNHALAARFVEFVLSEPGQRLWCLKRGTPGGPRLFELNRMPVLPGFALRFGEHAAVPFDPYAWRSGFTYDPEKGSLRWTILNDLIGATMIDPHQELVAAWHRVIELPAGSPEAQALFRPPLEEEALLELARGAWDDAEFRARTRARWANEAKARYRQIIGR